jgi:hypothetical protein
VTSSCSDSAVLLIGAEVLPRKISVKGGACAIARSDAPAGSALDGDLCAATGCLARGGRLGRLCAVAAHWPRVAAVTACLRVRPADLVAAPRPGGSRPAGRGRPPAPESARCPSPRLACDSVPHSRSPYLLVLSRSRGRSRPVVGRLARWVHAREATAKRLGLDGCRG